MKVKYRSGQEVQVVRQSRSRASIRSGGQAAHLKPSERDAVIHDLKEGMSLKEVSEAYGLSVRAVSAIRASQLRPAVPDHAPTERISFRVSKAEKLAFERAVAASRYKGRSDAMRSLVRQSVGLLDRNFAYVGEVKALYDELSSIGVNINQIARAVNRGQAPPLREAAGDLTLIKKELGVVLPRLNEIVQESRRRSERLWNVEYRNVQMVNVSVVEKEE